MIKIGRNQPCPCGSGKKYKRCCGLNAQAAGLSEVARIGPRWVKQMVEQTTMSALQVHSPNLNSEDRLATLNWLCAADNSTQRDAQAEHDSIELEDLELGVDSEVELDTSALEGAEEMTEGGDLKDESSLSPALRDVELATSNRRDKKLSSQIKLSLSQSVFEPFAVQEVLRGSGFKVKGCFSGRVYQINQAEDAERLEPMEWFFGRPLVFGRRVYLLEGWEKLPFKRRKALRVEVTDKLGAEEASLSWLREHSDWLLERCRAQIKIDVNIEEATL